MILFLINSSSCFSKKYYIFNNSIPFEKQLSEIVCSIDSMPGDEPIDIYVESGYYTLSHTINLKVGKHRIYLRGAKKKDVIISGSTEVKGWEVLPNGLWKAHVPSSYPYLYPDQLFVNGKRAKKTRIPKTGAFILKDAFKRGDLYGAVLNHNDRRQIPRIDEQDVVELSIIRNWAVSKRYMINSISTNDTLFFKGEDFSSNNPLMKGSGLVIENVKEVLREPGEWAACKNGMIYYYPQKGEIVEDTEFRIPCIEKLITINSDLENSAGLCFKNIIFEHTCYNIPEEGSVFDQAASGMSAAIEVANINDFLIEDCEIRNIANYGVWLKEQCQTSSVCRCYFHDLGAGAVKIGRGFQTNTDQVTCHIIVDNNIIVRYGDLMESAVGIIVFCASDCKITHNYIYGGKYTGISLGWVWGYGQSPTKNNEVAYNRVSHIGTGLMKDLGGIYTLGRSEGTHIHHNVISDVKSGNFMGWGLYADEGSSGIIFEKNIVYRCTSGGYHQHYGSDNVVTNNIFAWGEKSQFTLTSVKEERPLTFSRNIIIMDKGKLMSGPELNSNKWKIGYNCYWKTTEGCPEVGEENLDHWLRRRDSTSVFMNPNFKAPEIGDFRFKNNSVCKILGFKQFNCTNTGVYGNRKWKRLASVFE